MTMDVLWLIFVTVVGACVGSFLNVVAYRLPIGKSIVTPPSACPKCNHKLAWHDNIPVLGWIMLRGRCRYCANPISAQYPIIEAIIALLFGGWFYICYFSTLRPDFAGPGLPGTAPIFAVSLILIAGLMAATLIDARHYIIPLEIPWLVTAVAIVVLPLTVATQFDATVTVAVPARMRDGHVMLSKDRLAQVRPIYRSSAVVALAAQRPEASDVVVSAAPRVATVFVPAAVGGAVGLLISIVLLRLKCIPQSFADDPAAHENAGVNPSDKPQAVEDSSDPSTWIAHPHPRREVLKECLFLVPPAMGFLAGTAVTFAPGTLSGWPAVLGGVLIGYMAGGVTVWLTRILGTLGFGKEAMGLGDVHLMAAVGAVTGWQVAVMAFFIAPVFGLLWAAGSTGIAKLLRRQVRVIPYGPHLAIASLLVMVFREPMLERITLFLTGG